MIISNLVQGRKSKLQLHCSCTRGAQGSTLLTPPTGPPPAPWPSHILPPSPLLTAPPCHLVLFTQSHTHSQEFFLLISFHSEKQDEGALSDSRLPWKPPLFFFCQTCLHCNTHAHTCTHSYIESDRMLDLLKFKGTKATAVLLSAIVWAFCLLYTKNFMPPSLSSFSSHSPFYTNTLAF